MLRYSFLLTFLFFGCDKCKDVECFSSPESFYFQLIDKETNQNLLQNGTYKLSDIYIKPTFRSGVHNLELDSIEIEGRKEVVVIDREIGWQSGKEYKDYIFLLKDSLFHNFVYYTEEMQEECCTYYETKEVSSSTLEIEKVNTNSGILYKIEL